MNDYLLSLVLGIIEGVTEFLPVSSTAHLRIAEALMGVDLSSGYWKMYSIVIQLGAILCLPIYFRKRLADFLGSFPRGRKGDRTWLTHPLSLTLIAFVVTALPSLALVKLIGKHLESLVVMGWSLVVGGCVKERMRLACRGGRHAAARPGAAGGVAMSALPTRALGHLDRLEAESIHIFRELAVSYLGRHDLAHIPLELFEISFHTKMELDIPRLEPCSAAFCQFRRLWNFDKTECTNIKCARLFFLTSRHFIS